MEFCAAQHVVSDWDHFRALRSGNVALSSFLPAPAGESHRANRNVQEHRGPAGAGAAAGRLFSYRRSGSVPSLGDGVGLTMAWDESLGMERQSSDKMVAQDSGMAAIALEPLPPTAVTLQCAT